jgi:excisionase family DNA binding protein
VTSDELSAAARSVAALLVDLVEGVHRIEERVAATADLAVGEIFDDIGTTMRRTSLGRSTLLDLALKGEIPSIKVGARRLFPRRQLDAALLRRGT